MDSEATKLTVADLVLAIDRIEQWVRVVRKGLEALPQDQVIEIDPGEIGESLDLKQPFIIRDCL